MPLVSRSRSTEGPQWRAWFVRLFRGDDLMSWPRRPAWPIPSREDLRRGQRWPVPAEMVVRFVPPAETYAVDVELYDDADDEEPVVTGVAVRATAPTDASAPDVRDPWSEGATFDPLPSARAIQRLPIATYIRAAIVIAADPYTSEGRVRFRRTIRRLKPLGTADQSREDARLLARRDELRARGVRNYAPVIAQAIGADPATVRVMVHRADKRAKERAAANKQRVATASQQRRRGRTK